VSRADRDDAERDIGFVPEQPVRHVMDRAVAAHGHDPSDAVTGGPRRELGPVAWGLRPDDVHGPALAPELARHGVERPSASAAAPRCGAVARRSSADTVATGFAGTSGGHSRRCD